MSDYEERRNRLLGLLTSLGESDMERDNYEEAAKKYEKILELGVEEPFIYSQLSQAYLKLKRFDTKALNIYKKSLHYQPDDRVLCIALSEFFLKANRFDADAISAYQHALKFQSPLLRPLVLRLIKHYIDRRDVNHAKEIAIQTIHIPEIASDTLTFFLKIFWKEKKYDEVQNILKQSFRRTKDQIYLKALCLTYLEKYHWNIQQHQPLNFTAEDSIYCHQYLNYMKNFNTYEDLQFFIDILSFVLRYNQTAQKQNSFDTDEYEFFLSDGSPNKILAHAFSAKYSADESPFNFFKSIWSKLRAFSDSSEATSKTGRIDTTQKDAAINAHVCLIAKIKNYNTLNGFNEDNLRETQEDFFKGIPDMFQAEGICHVRRLYDGLFVLLEDASSACQMGTKLLRHIEKINHGKAKNDKVFISISIWKINNIHAENLPEIFEEVSCAIKISQLNHENFPESYQKIQSNFLEEHRLIISEEIKTLVNHDQALNTHLIGDIRVPLFPRACRIYEVEWNDPLERLRSRTLQKLGRFESLNQLAGSDNYSVFKGRDNLLDRIVVIKTIRSKILQQHPDEALACEQFLSEARDVSKLSHRNIVVIYDVGENSGFFYLAREYFEGIDLEKYVQQNDVKPDKALIKIFFQICSALKYAHKNEILHLNIKPANIIVGANQETKLTDFGYSNHCIKQRLAKNRAHVDLAYMSPEQLLQKPVDARSDIFSLGVLLYQSLTGQNPFYEADSQLTKEKILNQQLQLPSELDPSCPKVFDKIIIKTLAKPPENRYQTVHQIMLELYSHFKENAVEVLV